MGGLDQAGLCHLSHTGCLQSSQLRKLWGLDFVTSLKRKDEGSD